MLSNATRSCIADSEAPQVFTAGGHAGAASSDVYVFGTRNGTPLEPRNLTRMWTDLCQAQGIRAVPLHGLRHTCVSLLLAQGVHPRIVMEIVGHSAIEMTMNVYGHVNLDNQRKALEDLDNVNRYCQTDYKIVYNPLT